jgi:hypothetical protein
MLAWAVEEVQRHGAAAMLANVGPVMRCRVFSLLARKIRANYSTITYDR